MNSGQEELRAAFEQRFQNRSTMCPIELRREIIDEECGGAPNARAQNAHLGKTEGDNSQLLLATGEPVVGVPAVRQQSKIRAMGATQGITEIKFLIATRSEDLGQ